MNNDKLEVLIYMSDQHAASCLGSMGDKIVETPNLDKIASEGMIFDAAYTSCPLCVPARSSFMTGRFPSNIGVFNNDSDYNSSEITFAHMHSIAGYKTNLIGRMHFMGMDYYHGFDTRRSKDFSPSFWGNPSEHREDMGEFGRGLYQKWCLEVIGSGDSPVLDYDRMVVNEALKFYDESHKDPQLTVVGTYGPHCPYVADEILMNKYREKLQKQYQPESFDYGGSPVEEKTQETEDSRIIELRSAYYAMIETMDSQVGVVFNKYQEYLKREDKKGIFIYMSDHGDQVGYKKLYGKQTFFERSAKIPLIVSGEGISKGRISNSVSIMDVGPTLCEINKIDNNPVAEGVSFANLIRGAQDPNRYAIAEFYDMKENKPVIGYMVYQEGYKLITYRDFEKYDMLFDVHKDPSESKNLREENHTEYQKLLNILNSDSRISNHSLKFLENQKKYALLASYGKNHLEHNHLSYYVPQNVRKIEKIYL